MSGSESNIAGDLEYSVPRNVELDNITCNAQKKHYTRWLRPRFQPLYARIFLADLIN